jgi:NADH dehydrogenase
MSARVVTVFGASGFLGTSVVRALVKRDYRVLAAVRRPDLAGHLQPLGMVSQIHALQANLRFPESVANAVREADAVVNLVGILQPTGKQTFSAVQAEGARVVAEAAAARGIEHVVHVSAIGADADSSSAYARTKGEAERAVLAARPGAVIVRPSIIFGPGDSFFNRFAALGRTLPVMPLAYPETRFQPVYVGDVAEAIARAVDGHVEGGRAYELGGPEVKSFRELVEFTLEHISRRRRIVALSPGLARMQATLMETLDTLTLGLVPNDWKLTRDQLLLLQRDNVVSPEALREGRTLEAFGVAPTALEAIVPAYLVRYRPRGQFGTPDQHSI